MAGRADASAPTPHQPMNPLVSPRSPTRTAAHRAVGQRQQGGAAAQHAAPRHPERGARGHAVRCKPGADGITVHPRPDERHIRAARRARPRRAAEGLAAGRIQHRGQPLPQPDGLRARACARSSAPSCPTARASSPPTTAGTWPPDGERLRPLIAECTRPGRAREPVHGPAARGHGAGARAWAPTASSSTPSPMPRAHGHAGEQAAQLARFAAAAAAAQAAGPGRERRPRPEPRQPDRLPARRARRAGGLDRPCADRRCAGARPGRDGARLPALHPRGRRRPATAA